MGVTAWSLGLDLLFWCALLVVVTGGFDLQGSFAGRAFRLDATSPDLIVLLFLVLLAVWRRSGRRLGDLHCFRLWERAYNRLSLRSSPAFRITIGLVAAVFIAVPLFRHHAFSTGIDLALFAQAYWNTLQGDFLVSSIHGGTVLWGEHFNPIVLAILPIFWLRPSAETLLVLQSLALLAGAVPLYALARRELDGDGPAAWITLAYLLYLPVRQTNQFDFHPIALATPLILAAFLFLRRGSFSGFALMCLLVGATKETGPIAVGLLGSAWFCLQRRRWLGLGVAVAASIWFWFNLAVIMPAYDPAGVDTQLARYSFLGEDPWEMLATLVTRPLYVVEQTVSSRELFYPVRIFGPVAFLPFLTPLGLLTVPYLLINVLEASGVQVWLVHYQAELTAFVFVATVFGAKRLLRRRSRRTLAGLLTGGVLLFFGTSDVYELRKAWPSDHTRRIHAALERLPDEGGLSAQAALAPHLTRRSRLYVFPDLAEADWVVVDLGLDPWPVRERRLRRTVRRLKRSGFELEFEDRLTQIHRRTGVEVGRRDRAAR